MKKSNSYNNKLNPATKTGACINSDILDSPHRNKRVAYIYIYIKPSCSGLYKIRVIIKDPKAHAICLARALTFC